MKNLMNFGSPEDTNYHPAQKLRSARQARPSTSARLLVLMLCLLQLTLAEVGAQQSGLSVSGAAGPTYTYDP